MTTAGTTTTTAPATPPASAPQIDTAKITAQAVEAATKAASETAERIATEKATTKLKEAARYLTGEPEKPKIDPLVERILTQPAEVLHGIKEIAKQEMRAEKKAADDHVSAVNAVMTPLLKEYPQLNSPAHLAAVEKMTEQKQAAGMDYATALKAASDEAIKQFKLTSVTEATKNGTLEQLGIPSLTGSPGGGTQQRVSPEQANSDFIKSMRAASLSTRRKATTA